MKVKIVVAQRERAPGGDWGKAAQALLDMYGTGKRRAVNRWVVAARDIPPDVLEVRLF